jgi:hypothetical protein
MNDLLSFAIEAHGGLARWNKIKSIKVEGSITGAIWYVKTRPDVLKDIAVQVDTQKERVEMWFPRQDKVTVFQPDVISVKHEVEEELQEWKNPKSEFIGHTLHTPWEDVHVAYFSGEALWTYLTIPFLYTYPGFAVEELSPWQENGETWRRLKAIFPDNVTSHTKEQISYFGPDGLLRRHDYTVDILDGATGANYATDYRDIDGIIIPADRKIYAYEGEDHAVVKDPLLVSIEMKSIVLENQ